MTKGWRRPQWLPGAVEAPGVALALALGVLSMTLARVLPRSPLVSDVVIALILGALVVNTPLRRLVKLAPPGGPDRDADRAAPGLRFTGNWILRLGIILMGLKVQTGLFGGLELALIGGVIATTLPSTFFVTHALAAAFGVRRPLADVLAGGTMICGASAVNGLAPVAGAKREEQGVAIGVVFVFSVVALFAFRPIAHALGLSSAMAGIWSGLAVNDLSSAVAVGAQMGDGGGVMAAASKSARVLMLAPTLIILSLLRREGAQAVGQGGGVKLPRFVLGYLALAILRTIGDRTFGHGAGWGHVLTADKFLVDLTMSTVSAAIGLNIVARTLLTGGARALAVGGGASVWMASLSLAMVTFAARGTPSTAALIAVVALVASFVVYGFTNRGAAALQRLRQRFTQGAPLSLMEAKALLDAEEAEGKMAADDDTFRLRVLRQLHPSDGELIPVRKSPLPHGEGCRWVTYWQGQSGWAMVAMCREPGSETPIHAHPHRLLGKAIEGVLEELRFDDLGGGGLRLAERGVLAHDHIVTTDGLPTIHALRVVGRQPAIDLQLRGPEQGGPGRVFRADAELATLAPGTELRGVEEHDRRPGHGGEGAGVGVAPAEGSG